MHFKIAIPMYNVERWISTTINTIRKQDYDDFECVLVDDRSTDNTVQVVKKKIEGDKRFKILENEKKTCAILNLAKAIESSSPSSEDVIINIDGDDWLSTSRALSKIKKVYETTNCLLTYGSYVEYPSGFLPPHIRPFADDVLESRSFRSTPWRSTHLRTYKYKLFKEINKEDFRDSGGEYYTMTGDLALMFPMLEMASDRIAFVPDILYVYNNANPLNDHRINHTLQLENERDIRSKKKYPLKSWSALA